jgi:predicted small secreted protein
VDVTCIILGRLRGKGKEIFYAANSPRSIEVVNAPWAFGGPCSCCLLSCVLYCSSTVVVVVVVVLVLVVAVVVHSCSTFHGPGAYIYIKGLAGKAK